MPPTSNLRKGSAVSTGADANRRQSARQARTISSRPTNYYARPFGFAGGPPEEPSSATPPGFFPAIQYFTDSITALPKEVMRQLSLLKEVEAKIYTPGERLAQVTDNIAKLPTPPRRHDQLTSQPSFGFTVNNSANTSANASVVNGGIPGLSRQGTQALQAIEQLPAINEEADYARRHTFHDLRQTLHQMIGVMDEKIAVMTSTNQTLSKQLARVDSVMPHVEEEISEEARLGSLKHWAYAENRVKKQAGTAAYERARRDVAATNSLAAAAATVHEGEIAAARSEARREAMLAKRNRHQHVDSDFDDKPAPRKAPPKSKKVVEPAAEPKAAGLGITNGLPSSQAPKRRKTDKTAAALPMERTLSGAVKNARGTGAAPRPVPAVETHKKKTKATAVTNPKKRNGIGSGHPSPALVPSSPFHSTFNLPDPPPVTAQRPQTSRTRQNSTANLQNTATAEKGGPASAAQSRPTNGAGAGAPDLRGVSDILGKSLKDARSALKDPFDTRAQNNAEREEAQHTQSAPPEENGHFKHEDADRQDNEMPDAPPAPPSSSSGRAGRASKNTTPRTGADSGSELPMVRTRSIRTNGFRLATNSEPLERPKSAKKNQQKEELPPMMRQLASHNRSPVLGRGEEGDDDVSTVHGEDLSEAA
ncbi:hypothetical protein LTR66_001315, partial [Elasticomyces elasticus]